MATAAADDELFWAMGQEIERLADCRSREGGEQGRSVFGAETVGRAVAPPIKNGPASRHGSKGAELLGRKLVEMILRPERFNKDRASPGPKTASRAVKFARW